MRSFFLFILIFVTFSAHAQDHIVFNFNAVNMGMGVNLPIIKDHPMEGRVSVLCVEIEDKNRNIGIGFSPFMYFSWLSKEVGFDANVSSCFNLNLYRDFIHKNLYDDMIFYLGPYASVNYLFIDDRILWNKFMFNAGIQLGYRRKFERFNYNILSFETGYHNINGNIKLYAGIKVDIVAMLVIGFSERFKNIFY